MKLLKMLVSGALIALGVFAGTATVHAGIVEFDFTNWTDFGGANGQASFGPVAIGGVEVTLSSYFPNNMTFNGSAGEQAGCLSAGTTLACDGDGIGIVGGANNDEIDYIGNNEEALVIDIYSLYSYEIVSIELLDLFSGEEAEILADFGGGLGLEGPFSFPGSNPNGGYLLIPVGTTVSQLVFASFFTDGSDYSVARLTVNVPEPATVALLGLGLAGMGFRMRRRV